MASVGKVAAGSRIGNYVLDSLIAQGGMGAVYRARDDRLDLNNLGLVALHSGDLGRSLSLFLESLSLKRSFGDRSGAAEVIEGLAGVAGRIGDGLQAARFYGAADAIRTAIGAPLTGPERGPYEAYVAEARALTDTDRFERARVDGRRLEFEAAVEEAIGWAQGMTEDAG